MGPGQQWQHWSRGVGMGVGSHERPQDQGAAGPRLPTLVPGGVDRAADPVGEQLGHICYVTAKM